MAEIKKPPVYNAAPVRSNYYIWYDFLENIVISLPTFNNLPANLPSREIMRSLIRTGHCGIYNDARVGIVSPQGASLSGIGLYSYPTTMTTADPVLGSKTLTIGLDCVVIFSDSQAYLNNKTSTILYTIQKYARLLAEITSSIAISCRNTRNPVWAVAQDEKTKQAVMSYLDAVAEGKSSVIATNDKVFDTFKGVQALSPSAATINDLYDAIEDTLRCFYREIGIRYIEQKAERMIVPEMGSMDEVLFTNIRDMMNCIDEGINNMNTLFGTNVSCEWEVMKRRESYGYN